MKLKMYKMINLNNKNKRKKVFIRKKVFKVEDIQLLNTQEIDSKFKQKKV